MFSSTSAKNDTEKNKRKYDSITIEQNLKTNNEERNVKIRMNNRKSVEDPNNNTSVQMNFKSTNTSKFTIKFNESHIGFNDLTIQSNQLIHKSLLYPDDTNSNGLSITNEIESLNNDGNRYNSEGFIMSSKIIKEYNNSKQSQGDNLKEFSASKLNHENLETGNINQCDISDISQNLQQDQNGLNGDNLNASGDDLKNSNNNQIDNIKKQSSNGENGSVENEEKSENQHEDCNINKENQDDLRDNIDTSITQNSRLDFGVFSNQIASHYMNLIASHEFTQEFLNDPRVDVKLFPSGISDFKKIIEEGLIYIDKTSIIDKLLGCPLLGCELYISRPKGFGKTLLISVLKYLFSGKHKYLFNKLDIAKNQSLFEDIGNNGYPVFDFSFEDLVSVNEYDISKAASSLENNIKLSLEKKAEEHGIELKKLFKIGEMVEHLIIHIVKKAQRDIVILIDACDKPLLNFIHDEESFNKINDILISFHKGIKEVSNQRLVKFLLMTGSIEPSTDSVYYFESFRDQVTINPELHDICGFSLNEIERYFEDFITNISNYSGKSLYNIKRTIKEDMPFHVFSFNYTDVTNRLISPQIFYNYLIGLKNHSSDIINKLITEGNMNILANTFKISNFNTFKSLKALITEEILHNYVDLNKPFHPKNLKNDFDKFLFQLGYLTLDIQINNQVRLKYPNQVAKKLMIEFIMKILINKIIDNEDIINLLNYLVDEKFKDYMTTLHSKLHILPSECIPQNSIEKEMYFEIIFLLMHSLRMPSIHDIKDLVLKSCYNNDQIDPNLIIEHQANKRVYLFKFKANTNPGDFITALQASEYFKSYEKDDKFEDIFILAVNLNLNKNNIDKYMISKFCRHDGKLNQISSPKIK